MRREIYTVNTDNYFEFCCKGDKKTEALVIWRRKREREREERHTCLYADGKSPTEREKKNKDIRNTEENCRSNVIK